MSKRFIGRLCHRAVALGLVLILICASIPAAGAVTQSEINAKKSQQSDLKSQISSVQSQISALEQQENSALSQSLLYQQQIDLLMEQIEDTNELIAEYDEQIADTQVELAEAQAKSEEYYKIFCERVRDLEEGGEVNYWAILFNASSFSDLLDRVNFIQNVITYDNSVVDMLEESRQEVADTEARLEQERSEQQDALEELEQQKEDAQAASDRNDELLAQIVANQSTYQSQLAELESESAALDASIVADEAQYAAQVAAVQAAAAQAASSSSSSGSSVSASGGSTYSGSGATIANYALQFLGNKYVYGGSSLTNGCDCSGFVMAVYAHFGISLPHSSKAQATCGVKVSYSEARAGDIIYYNSSGSPTGGHVGIYIGGGQMISALNSRRGICITVVNSRTSGFTVRRIVSG